MSRRGLEYSWRICKAGGCCHISVTDQAILDACFFIKILNNSFFSCAGIRAELVGCEMQWIREKWHSILTFKEYPNCKYPQQLFISCNFSRSSSLIMLCKTIAMHLMQGSARGELILWVEHSGSYPDCLTEHFH